MRTNTTPIQASDEGLSNLVLVQGSQMDDRQWIRELVVNVAQNDGDAVTFDSWTDPETGHALTRVSDNAHGMSETELRRHVGTILNSSHGVANNFGWGSRVSTLAHNPAGVTFASRKDAGEAMMTIHVDRGVIGAKIFEIDEGHRSEAVAPDAGMLDRVDALAGKAGNGTAVILHGKGRSSTYDASVAHKAIEYVGSRFFEFPPTSTGNPLAVRVMQPRTEGSARSWIVPSYSERLGKTATASGILEFATDRYSGRMYWAVIPNVTAQNAKKARALIVHPGAGMLCDGEIFDMRLANFAPLGIPYESVKRRIVVLVEIDGAEMDTGRSSLIFRSSRGATQRAPWKEIGDFFVSNMPDPIRALLDERKASGTSLPETLAAQLDARWMDRIKPVPVKIAGSGAPGVGDEPGTATPTKDPVGRSDTPAGTGPSRPKRPVQPSGSGTGASREVMRKVLPVVEFVAREDVGNVYGIEWNEASGVMLVASDLVPFTRSVENFAADTDEPRELIEEAVRIAFGLELAATVIDAHGAVEWNLTPAQAAALLTPEALLAKLLGAQSIDSLIRNQIRAVKAGV